MSHNQNEAGWRYQSDGYATLSINEGSQDEQHNNGGSNYDAPNDGHQDYGSNSDRFYNNKPHGESSHAFVPPVHSRRAHGWKPWTLRAPFLLLILLLSLALAGSIELLAQRSHQKGGLALSRSADDLSVLTTFSYLYLPTIIAVLYSLCWAFVEVDAKRLQPFLELSREGGVSGRDSLFLEYPFEFIIWIPFKALHRRHWPVFISGLVVVLIFLLITPLQSAIMRVGQVVLTSDASFSLVDLPAVSDQAIQMDLGVLSTGYSISWLGQPVPGFTTRDYALLPVVNPDVATPPGKDANITVATTKLSTSLTCWPAILSGQNSLLNGRGCNYSDFVPRGSQDSPYEIAYITYHSSAASDYFLAGPSCGIAAENQFLAIWTQWNNPPINVSTTLAGSNMTASFCETSYSKQNVSVSLSAGNYTPYDDSIVVLGPEQPLTSAEFNMTAFEYLIGNGDPVLLGDIGGSTPPGNLRDTSFMFRVEQYPRLLDTGLNWPMTPMTGFAMAGQDQNIAVYSDPAKLHAIFEKAHRLFFSIVVSTLTSKKSPGDVALPGNIEYAQYGVIVSRPFAIVVEGLLLLVAILAGALIWCCWSSPSKLQHDPDSLSALIELIRYSDDVKSLFTNRDSESEALMVADLEGLHYSLSHVQQGEEIITVLRVERGVNQEMTQISNNDNEYHPLRPDNFTPVKPKLMRRGVGLLFITTLLGVMGLLAYFKWAERSYGGLSLPTHNEIALQVLENYLPTVFATSIEPLWVVLNRLLCITQPFKDLWRGHSPGSRSIEARYTSLPPQLVVWRAIKSRHLLLAFICVISLLANVLAVALGGLFNESPTSVGTPVLLKQTQSTTFSEASVARLSQQIHAMPNPYQDNMRVISANLSDGTPLPPWLTNDYFFSPLELDSESWPETESFTVQTTGFTAMPSCTHMDEAAHSLYSFNTSGGQFNISLVGGDNQPIQCSAPVSTFYGTIQVATGDIAQENFQVMIPSSVDPLDPCLNVLFFHWNRATGFNGTVQADTVKPTYVICQPRVASAVFNVTVDPLGAVRTSARLSDFDMYPMAPGLTAGAKLLQNASRVLLYASYPNWHNDTAPRNWVSYLLKLAGSDALDPQTALDPTTLVPQLESIYKRTFAALLQQNPQTFDDLDGAAPSVGATRRTTETRIFMPDAAFIISIAILGLDVVAALLVYWRNSRFALPRNPTTIGSIIGYVAASPIATWEWKYWGMGATDRTYRLGRYDGIDGKEHFGIHADAQ